jgi:hypothetical protein
VGEIHYKNSSKCILWTYTETIREMRNFETVYRFIRDVKSKFINPNPYRYEGLKLSFKLTITHTENEFYRYGVCNYGKYEVNEDIIIFFK